jgi:hypothetical protein
MGCQQSRRLVILEPAFFCGRRIYVLAGCNPMPPRCGASSLFMSCPRAYAPGLPLLHPLCGFGPINRTLAYVLAGCNLCRPGVGLWFFYVLSQGLRTWATLFHPLCGFGSINRTLLVRIPRINVVGDMLRSMASSFSMDHSNAPGSVTTPLPVQRV